MFTQDKQAITGSMVATLLPEMQEFGKQFDHWLAQAAGDVSVQPSGEIAHIAQMISKKEKGKKGSFWWEP